MRVMNAALFVVVFLFVSHLNGGLQAYLDPGTGSMVLQALLAGFAAAIALGRLYWSRLKGLVSRGAKQSVDRS